jgi:hypothetical protein
MIGMQGPHIYIHGSQGTGGEGLANHELLNQACANINYFI